MKIDILAVGRIKEAFMREGVSEYLKRLSRYCDIQVIEVADEKTPDAPTEREKEVILQKEGERLLKKLPENAWVVALAIDGRKYSSEGLAEHIQELMVGGRSHLVFVIGGSLGLHRDILKRADERLSFSDMTFPHQLMRLILAEQLYRTFRISRNEPYHK